MADSDSKDNFDKLIDSELDAYFTEKVLGKRPSSRRRHGTEYGTAATPPEPDFSSTASEDSSLDQAVDSLFRGSFDALKSSSFVTSGDDETDRAIDLAVDTLFVEEPEEPAPETAELEAHVVQSHRHELDEPEIAGPDEAGVPEEEGQQIYTESRGLVEKQSPPVEKEPEPSYDRGPAEGIDFYPEAFLEPKPAETSPTQPSPGVQKQREDVGAREMADSRIGHFRQLQEAILTLEWEISRRSVTTLEKELRRLRSRFRDDVTVDFAALAMRVVLDYIVKRMSRAHPESIRFLLEVTGLVRSTAASTKKDPLATFHKIVTRYEKYKSVVRRAERIPDDKPSAVPDLAIENPDDFAKMVKRQAKTLAMAGQSLADRIDSSDDPETLIRSFRFLVTRSLNRILEGTRKDKSSGVIRRTKTPEA